MRFMKVYTEYPSIRFTVRTIKSFKIIDGFVVQVIYFDVYEESG